MSNKDSIVACARIQEGAATWLSARKVSHVAMEATGVYWRPPWHILQDAFTLVLANAMHIKNVPGRKTDVNDATWIADLLAQSLIGSSFVPPQPRSAALPPVASIAAASGAPGICVVRWPVQLSMEVRRFLLRQPGVSPPDLRRPFPEALALATPAGREGRRSPTAGKT